MDSGFIIAGSNEVDSNGRIIAGKHFGSTGANSSGYSTV